MITPSLRSTVNLANPDAFDNVGAAPNGADYVQLRNGTGTMLRGRDLRSVQFRGTATLPPLPLEWTLVNDDPTGPATRCCSRATTATSTGPRSPL